MATQPALTTWLVALGAVSAALSAQAAGVGTASGRVYQDANSNGRLDAGEQGISGVRVTDGVGFVTSGADGT